MPIFLSLNNNKLKIYTLKDYKINYALILIL